MEKEPTIVLPKPHNTKTKTKIHTKLDFFSEINKHIDWIGYGFINKMYYLYLFSKYKSNCLVGHNGLPGMVLEINKYYMSRSFPLEIEFISSQLANCIERNVDIIIIPFYLYLPQTGHANILIYRKKGNVIEHFEPYGQTYSFDERINMLINRRLDQFIYVLNQLLSSKNQVSLIRATEVCPRVQGIQELESIATYNLGFNEEYCVAWSMFFAELALKNPTLSSNELLTIVYEKLGNMRDGGSNYLRKVIIGYVNIIYDKCEKYFSFILGEKITMDELKELMRTNNILFDEINNNLNIVYNIQNELINNPSLTKENYLSMLEDKERSATNPLEKQKIRDEINVLNTMSLLLNPSPPTPTPNTPEPKTLETHQKPPEYVTSLLKTRKRKYNKKYSKTGTKKQKYD